MDEDAGGLILQPLNLPSLAVNSFIANEGSRCKAEALASLPSLFCNIRTAPKYAGKTTERRSDMSTDPTLQESKTTGLQVAWDLS